MAFVANLFNQHPGLKPPQEDIVQDIEEINETREEKMYRNWMNSLGVSPAVNYIYSDLYDGIIIFQVKEFYSSCVDSNTSTYTEVLPSSV